jgi:hypothetical protein
MAGRVAGDPQRGLTPGYSIGRVVVTFSAPKTTLEQAMTRTRRAITWIVAANLGLVSMLPVAHAGMVGTDAVAAVTAAPATDGHARLMGALQREDVVRALAERGVSRDSARERVAALTDAQAAQLADQIDQAPAGGDVLGVIVGIFVLLLITDILGFTKVFPFTRAIR